MYTYLLLSRCEQGTYLHRLSLCPVSETSEAEARCKVALASPARYDLVKEWKDKCDNATNTPFPNEELCKQKICLYYDAWLHCPRSRSAGDIIWQQAPNSVCMPETFQLNGHLSPGHLFFFFSILANCRQGCRRVACFWDVVLVVKPRSKTLPNVWYCRDQAASGAKGKKAHGSRQGQRAFARQMNILTVFEES